MRRQQRSEIVRVLLCESGAIRVPIAQTFALEEARAAYEGFAAGGKLGKIVLEMGGRG